MKANRFTFKRQPREKGLRRVGHPWPPVTIKLGGRQCGWIQPRSWSDDGWNIWIKVEKDADHDDGNPNRLWINLRVAGPFDSEPEAREWVNEHAEELQTKYRLHLMEG